MAGKLAQEIRQSKPPSLEEEVILNLLRTAEVLSQRQSVFLKPYDLSPTQYNVLRILRGARPAGIACSQLSERMVTRDPDITRLLDRMEARSLVVRERSQADRRVIIVQISPAGLDLVNSLDQPLARLLKDTVGKMDKTSQMELVDHLEQLRELLRD